jgi:hypothetical protein
MAAIIVLPMRLLIVEDEFYTRQGVAEADDGIKNLDVAAAFPPISSWRT